MASQRQTQSKTQSFKRKPGQANNERSTGDYNERVNSVCAQWRAARTRVQTTGRATPGRSQTCTNTSSMERRHTTLRHTMCQRRPAKAAGRRRTRRKTNDEDVAMETEDQEEDLQAAEVQELKPEQLDSTKAPRKGQTAERWRCRGRERRRKRRRGKDRQQSQRRGSGRSTESTIHTVPELRWTPCRKLKETQRRSGGRWSYSWSPGTNWLQNSGGVRLLQVSVVPQAASKEKLSEAAASSMWHQYQTLTSALSQQLCEQLRLILEPTTASNSSQCHTPPQSTSADRQ
ncbi:hypothetical protein INR49_004490 [Caranx melampygus]|nr:hypothetical protein INR49_004490 [Caranx melampygus]